MAQTPITGVGCLLPSVRLPCFLGQALAISHCYVCVCMVLPATSGKSMHLLLPMQLQQRVFLHCAGFGIAA